MSGTNQFPAELQVCMQIDSHKGKSRNQEIHIFFRSLQLAYIIDKGSDKEYNYADEIKLYNPAVWPLGMDEIYCEKSALLLVIEEMMKFTPAISPTPKNPQKIPL